MVSRQALCQVCNGLQAGRLLCLQVSHGILKCLLSFFLISVSLSLFLLSLLKDETQHRHSVCGLALPCLREVFLRINCSLHPAHGVESCTARVSRASLLQLLNRCLWDTLDVAASSILACLLFVVMRAGLGMQPIIEFLQDLQGLVKCLLRVDKVDYVGLVHCILKATSLNLIGLVLAVLSKFCVFVCQLLLQTSLCIFNRVGKLNDLSFKRFFVGCLIVQLGIVVFALRITPCLLLIISLFLLGDQLYHGIELFDDLVERVPHFQRHSNLGKL